MTRRPFRDFDAPRLKEPTWRRPGPPHAAPAPADDLTEAIAELRRTFAEWLRDLARQAQNAQGDATETASLLLRLGACARAAASLTEENPATPRSRPDRRKPERTPPPPTRPLHEPRDGPGRHDKSRLKSPARRGPTPLFRSMAPRPRPGVFPNPETPTPGPRPGGPGSRRSPPALVPPEPVPWLRP